MGAFPLLAIPALTFPPPIAPNCQAAGDDKHDNNDAADVCRLDGNHLRMEALESTQTLT